MFVCVRVLVHCMIWLVMTSGQSNGLANLTRSCLRYVHWKKRISCLNKIRRRYLRKRTPRCVSTAPTALEVPETDIFMLALP